MIDQHKLFDEMWSWVADAFVIFSTFLTGLIESFGIICDESEAVTRPDARIVPDDELSSKPCDVLLRHVGSAGNGGSDERRSCTHDESSRKSRPRKDERGASCYYMMPTWSLVQHDPRLWSAMRKILRANLFVTLLAIATSQLSLWHHASSGTSPSMDTPMGAANMRADYCSMHRNYSTYLGLSHAHSSSSPPASPSSSSLFSVFAVLYYGITRKVHRTKPYSALSSSCMLPFAAPATTTTATATATSGSNIMRPYKMATSLNSTTLATHIMPSYLPSVNASRTALAQAGNMPSNMTLSFLSSELFPFSFTFSSLPLTLLLRLFVWIVMYSGQWPLFVTFQLIGLVWYSQLYSEVWLLRKGLILTRSPAGTHLGVSSPAQRSRDTDTATREHTVRCANVHSEQRIVCHARGKLCGSLDDPKASYLDDAVASATTANTNSGMEEIRAQDDNDRVAECRNAGSSDTLPCASHSRTGAKQMNDDDNDDDATYAQSSNGMSASTYLGSCPRRLYAAAATVSENGKNSSDTSATNGSGGKMIGSSGGVLGCAGATDATGCRLTQCLLQSVWCSGQLFCRLLFYRLPPTPQSEWIVGDRRTAGRQLRWKTCSLDQRLRIVSEMWFKFCATFLFSWFIVLLELFSPFYWVGKVLGFVLNALLFSFYVLDYRYSTQLLSSGTQRVRLAEQIAHFERHWAYYIGYGASATTALYLVTATIGPVASVCVGSIVYAWQVVCSGYTQPRLMMYHLPVFTPWFHLVDRMRKLSLGLLWRIAAVLFLVHTLRCSLQLLYA